MVDNSKVWNTPQELSILEKLDSNSPVGLLEMVAKEIDCVVPDVAERSGAWRHGSCRVIGTIGGKDCSSLRNGMSQDFDLEAELGYVAFYRQAVENKNTGKVKYFFVSIPIDVYGSLTRRGQSVAIPRQIEFIWNKRDVEKMARESLLKLQEMVLDYHNAREESMVNNNA